MTTTFGDVQWQTYAVAGATLQEVWDALSGLEEAGTAHWEPAYTTQIGEDGTITSAEVTVASSITVPEWSDSSSASPAAQAEWSRWWAALEAHEQGHIALVHEHLARLDQRLVGRPKPKRTPSSTRRSLSFKRPATPMTTRPIMAGTPAR